MGTDFKEYLNKDVKCECGRVHRCSIDRIILKAGAIKELPGILLKYHYQKICVVADGNTYETAGAKVCNLLHGAGISYSKIVFSKEELIPDEKTLGTLLTELPFGCDLILAVGSGTINDLCKYLSFRLGIDYFIIATAPSMDGYASNVAPLIVKNLKTTYEVGMPRIILGDTEILKEAPMSMIAAGVGDILGKYVCLTDWKLAHLINGEYHCNYVESLIRKSIDAVVKSVPGLKERDEDAIQSVMEGLVLSGIAMSYTGNSRPASGSEHHMSHYWEMMSLFQGSHGALHGTKVGIGTVMGIMMYKKLPAYLEDFRKNGAEGRQGDFDLEGWEKEIREAYLKAAPQVLKLESEVHKNSEDGVKKRLGKLNEHTEQILKLTEALPEAESIKELLQAMDAPCYPWEIGVSTEDFKNSILYAKDLRNRFGLLQLYYDLGRNDELAEQMIKEIPWQYRKN